MWHDSIGEMMRPHISIGIWGLWCPQPKTEILSVTIWYLVKVSYSSLLNKNRTRTVTRSWCSCRQNSRICSHSATPLQSCAPTGRPICDPKPDDGKNKHNYFGYVTDTCLLCWNTGQKFLNLLRALCCTSNLAQSHEVFLCVGLCTWPNWISYVALELWTFTGNSTLRNLWDSAHFT